MCKWKDKEKREIERNVGSGDSSNGEDRRFFESAP